MNNAESPSIEAALAWARKTLSQSDSGALDSRVLLCHCLGKGLSYLMTWPDKALTDSQWQDFQTLVCRRASGEPVAYLTGHREFWDLDLQVSPDTLIPRPETEHLVEAALENTPKTSRKVLDLGTGTGAVALALAKERPAWQVLGVDYQSKIIELAASNARRNGINNVRFQVSDWFQQLSDTSFDLIVSNPPYIDDEDHWLAQGDVRFEPRSALVSGNQGLADIEAIASQSGGYLSQDGLLIFEHGYQQGPQVRAILIRQGFSRVTTLSDLAGLERITLGYR
ncbi:Peptide chain release factor N(5)-glutamine methyltransferase [Saliniradius amylolyticus]|uniref:Release factor glutamine methyltransferase n=1 Tax=Saliniradius amylolyticus TaxID=2183582 RepID=A0A2S2E1V7_9ALTE|nr:peptide chain release factor N(5)-glutamine methyltransferase [Saliniradius amylolyticus]AWL11502.1 Peptide chain release factor N(5)-glutamine methyltransferase [Saliniradius amylolyticus]